MTRMYALGLLALWAAPLTAQQAAPAPGEPRFQEVFGDREFTGRMIACPRSLDDWAADGIGGALADSYRTRALKLLENYVIVEHVLVTDDVIFEVPEDSTENLVADELIATDLFRYVHPDWMLFPLDCPDDPRLGSQWHHNANRMNSCSGWDLHTGCPSVIVAICDTGIRKSHEDFARWRHEGYNAVARLWERDGGQIAPVHPHGTQTTGCAAANGDNGVGVAGVGWSLGHRMMRVSNDSGGGASLSTLQHAARTAVERGDRVASVSYSGVDAPSILNTATYIKGLDGMLVWAAGNDGRNLNHANRDDDDLIVVGGTDSNDAKASFSAFGTFVDLVAPAVGVHTTDSGHDSDYASVSGTSFACPLTAGLAGVIWSANASLTHDEVEAILKQGCDDLGNTGVDNTFGYGRIEVRGSLDLVPSVGGILPENGILFSVRDTGTYAGFAMDREDIQHLDPSTGTFSQIFDASDVIPGITAHVNGLHVLPDGSCLMTFHAPVDIPGLTGGPNAGLVDDSDIVRFIPTQWGPNTTGSFDFYFDGSDVGLSVDSADVDAISTTKDGDLVISTRGNFNAGFDIRDEDVLLFTATSLGDITSGTLELYMDGSKNKDTKLGRAGENVTGVHLVPFSGDLMLTTVGPFRVPQNKRGQDDDIFKFDPKSYGFKGKGFMTLIFDGTDYGLDAADIDGMHIMCINR